MHKSLHKSVHKSVQNSLWKSVHISCRNLYANLFTSAKVDFPLEMASREHRDRMTEDELCINNR